MVDGHSSDNDFFTDLRVAIVGLGLMGGSLALGLRGHCREVLAVEPDLATQELALRQGIVSSLSADPADILPRADLVVLAAPVGAILELIPRLPDLQPGTALIIDLGSTKTMICQALEQLPDRFEAVGGHPMCGKAVAGLPVTRKPTFSRDHLLPLPFYPTPAIGLSTWPNNWRLCWVPTRFGPAPTPMIVGWLPPATCPTCSLLPWPWLPRQKPSNW